MRRFETLVDASKAIGRRDHRSLAVDAELRAKRDLATYSRAPATILCPVATTSWPKSPRNARRKKSRAPSARFAHEAYLEIAVVRGAQIVDFKR